MTQATHKIPDDLAAITRHLTQSLKALEKVIAGLSPRVWSKKSRGDTWSVEEIVHHLVLVEVQGLQELKDVVTRKQEGAVFAGTKRETGDSGTDIARLRLPSPKLKTKSIYNPASGIPNNYLLDGLRRARRETIAYLQEIGLKRLKEVSIESPWGSILDGAEFLDCLSYHMERHIEQVSQIIKKQ